MRQLFYNAILFDGEQTHHNAFLVVNDQHIETVSMSRPDGPFEYSIDMNNQIIAPGFIDLQVNGGGGVLLNDQPTPEGIRAIVEAHQRFGTVAMLPTLISDSLDKMKTAVQATEYAISHRQAGVLGIHLEGPFLNPVRKGVHNAEFFQPLPASMVAFLAAAKAGEILLTLAPEQSERDTIEAASKAGVHVFAGHTGADYQQTKAGLTAGIKGFTHLFNAMTPMTSRAPGVVGAALEDSDSWCGIIVDGFHVDPTTLKVAIAAKPKGKILLVTDAMPTVGMVDKQFTLNGETIRAKNGRCATANDTLAGSDLDMITAVQNTVNWLGIEWQEAIRMASTYPAQAIGVDHQLGFLKPKFLASFVVLNKDLNLTEVWVEGTKVA